MKKITKNKFYLLIGLFIISFIVLATSVQMHLKNKTNYDSLPEVKLNELKNSNLLAIMVQNGDDYKEYDSDTWPGDGYIYKEAKCTDNNGAIVDDAITFADGKATLTTNQTVFCTLYFDEKPDPAKDLRAKDPSGNLSTDLQGGMYRYQGTDNVPNWICFGTRNADECKSDPDGIDKYMYRIIGITEEGQMYLIKETFLKEGSVTDFSWNDEYKIDSGVDLCPDGKCPEWNEADLFQRINGTANGTKAGKGDNDDKVDNDTDIFVDSAQYDYLKSGDSNSGGSSSEWYNLIANHEWMYGDTTSSSYNGDTLYDIETGKTETTHYAQNPEGSTTVEQQTYTWSQKVTAKISLMYLHDYYYGYYDGSSEDSRGNAGSYSKLKNSWIHFQKDGYNSSPSYEWLSTRWGDRSKNITGVCARNVDRSGDVPYGYLDVAIGVRPVFYLESSAKIASGEGTKDSPFILA